MPNPHRHIAQFIAANTHATNATVTGEPVDCRDLENLRLVIKAANTSTPDMDIKLQGSEDKNAVLADKATGGSTADWFDVEIPDGALEPGATGITDPAADWTEVNWPGAANLFMVLNLEKPYAFMRLVMTSNSGGSASVYVRAYGGGR